MRIPWTLARALLGVLALAALASGCSSPPLLYEGARDQEVEPIEVRLIRITDGGLDPRAPTELTVEDGGVAFVNDTRDKLVAVVFPDLALSELRCSYTVAFESEGRSTFTERPLPPGAAASICLHDAGSLRFEVHGLGERPLEGRIEVREAPAPGKAGAALTPALAAAAPSREEAR